MRTSRLLALLGLLAAGPAWAGNYITLKCPDGSFSREFMVGSGRQIQGQGLELWPMVCTATGKFATYPRIANADRFARLEALAKRPAKDKAEVRSVFDLSAELGGDAPSDLFDQAEELTFGDIRSTVANVARPTTERLGETNYTAWSHPTCAGKLIPFDYYLDSGTPCPACADGKLSVDSGNRTEWQ